jgi:mono/diheme cytochrome c family protein
MSPQAAGISCYSATEEIRGPAPILAQTAHPFDGFRELPRDPPGDMPAYSEAVLSDKDIADIYAFIESMPGPRSPKDIRALDN